MLLPHRARRSSATPDRKALRTALFLSWLPVTSLTVVAAHLTNLRPTAIVFVQCNNGAKSFEQVIEIQSQYAKKAYDTYTAELSKLGEMYAGLTRNAYKPVEQAAAKAGSPNRRSA